jgi:hypothetical protein
LISLVRFGSDFTFNIISRKKVQFHFDLFSQDSHANSKIVRSKYSQLELLLRQIPEIFTALLNKKQSIGVAFVGKFQKISLRGWSYFCLQIPIRV